MRTSTVLRWVHLLLGLLISVSFLAMLDGGWPADVRRPQRG